MKLVVTNEITELKGRKGYCTHSDCGLLKKGYSIFDGKELVGVAYIADDKRRAIYHKGTIFLFNEAFERKYDRIWYTVKINGDYLWFEDLKKNLEKGGSYTIDVNI